MNMEDNWKLYFQLSSFLIKKSKDFFFLKQKCKNAFKMMIFMKCIWINPYISTKKAF